MKNFHYQRKGYRFFHLASSALILVLLSVIPIRLAIATTRAPFPQAILTSAFHMPRAKAIATLVLGSQGIAFTPVLAPSDKPPESWLHILRDTGRALLWSVTGHTGASLNPKL